MHMAGKTWSAEEAEALTRWRAPCARDELGRLHIRTVHATPFPARISAAAAASDPTPASVDHVGCTADLHEGANVGLAQGSSPAVAVQRHEAPL